MTHRFWKTTSIYLGAVALAAAPGLATGPAGLIMGVQGKVTWVRQGASATPKVSDIFYHGDQFGVADDAHLGLFCVGNPSRKGILPPGGDYSAPCKALVPGPEGTGDVGDSPEIDGDLLDPTAARDPGWVRVGLKIGGEPLDPVMTKRPDVWISESLQGTKRFIANRETVANIRRLSQGLEEPERYRFQAEYFFAIGDPEKALKPLKKLEKKADDPSLIRALGDAHLRSGNLEKAESAYRRFLDTSGESQYIGAVEKAYVNNAIGSILESKGDLAEAAGYLRNALELYDRAGLGESTRQIEAVLKSRPDQ